MNATTHVNSELQSIIKKYADLDMFEGYEIISPDSPGPSGDTPFHMVAFDGDVESAKIMLPYVSDINVSGDLGNSPLHYAVMRRNPEMARFLISNGADVAKKNDYGDTPTDYMESEEEFRGFLDNK